MDCGAEEFACQAIALITNNELAASALLKLVGQTSEQAVGLIGLVGAFLKEHGDKLIGLAGFSFGVWRWWRYREQILHKRLAEYLRESDRRLLDGQTYVLDAIQRPVPSQPLKTPLFASRQLRSVLMERRWDNSVMAASVERSCDTELNEAADIIRRQIQTAEKSIASLREQFATANILRGAIAASSSNGAREINASALAFFRTALQVPGHDQNIVAKELEAHQLRRLGQFGSALEAYAGVENLAQNIVINDNGF